MATMAVPHHTAPDRPLSPLNPRFSSRQQSLNSVAPQEPSSDASRSSLGSRWLSSWEWDVLVLSTAVKVLLFPAYRSTDFEVHRNWMAITHSLPMSKWYFDNTSEWTLDYPPFFAYFEYLLSIPASLIDERMVDLTNLNYGSWSVIAYQRSTVILTEIVLGAALIKYIRGTGDSSLQRILCASLFLHPGFLIVDHIHFQYNGFLFGILLWSIVMAQMGQKLASGLLFAVLLNFKHIYIYLAPAYFIYLLRTHCMSPTGHPLLPQFLSLANAVILVFVISLGPFALLNQLPQLLSRLFPFTRGLNHAYWAPNAWALTTGLDRVLLRLAQKGLVQLPLKDAGVTSSSRGLVGDTSFAVLPDVPPIFTFAITLIVQSVFLVKLWLRPTYRSFLTALTLCAFASFSFGWHVHEKAVLLVLVPLSLLAAESHTHFRVFRIASTAGIVSLLPLLFTPTESIISLVYSALWLIVVFQAIGPRLYQFPRTKIVVIIELVENTYLLGFIVLETLVTALAVRSYKLRTADSSLFGPKAEHAATARDFQFLPLMLTSLYCAAGILWAFIRLSYQYLVRE